LKNKGSDIIEFKAGRYITLRKVFFLYQVFMFANDPKRNREKIADRNVDAINTTLYQTWFIIEFALFTTLYTIILDLLDIRYKTKSNLLHKDLKPPLGKKVRSYKERISKVLEEYDLAKYSDLMNRLKIARDKYIVHTEVLAYGSFPIKLEDLVLLEKFLDEVEEKVLQKEIKETMLFQEYLRDKNQTELLREFDNLMNSLRRGYLIGDFNPNSFDLIGDYLSGFFEELEDLEAFSLIRAKENAKASHNIFLDVVEKELSEAEVDNK
jgi:hypothetical protein